MLRLEVSKNSSTALSSHDGAFVTSTTTSAPASALANPSPVMVLTPDEGEADTASWPRPRRIGMSFFPMSPLPPITTIFMLDLLGCCPNRGDWKNKTYSTLLNSPTLGSQPAFPTFPWLVA